MATQTTSRPVETVSTYATKRLWKRGLIAGAIAAVLALNATYMIFGEKVEKVTPANAPAVETRTLSREDIMRDLVNRGLVPGQALHPASESREDIMRDLVNRGLIPPQSLDD